MSNFKVNVEVRMAQLGLTGGRIEETGFYRTALGRVKRNPGSANMSTMRRLEMVLFCPLSVLLGGDQQAVVAYRLPKSDHIDAIVEHKEALGFEAGEDPVTFDKFLSITGL